MQGRGIRDQRREKGDLTGFAVRCARRQERGTSRRGWPQATREWPQATGDGIERWRRGTTTGNSDMEWILDEGCGV
ncbi:unnamed protein product [Linum trigynum]|uniref:Uncharacterized protein n=1 Tax=Linum trigynum TaxID=586398 RepID=A0AAV2DEG8_9ROSI